MKTNELIENNKTILIFMNIDKEILSIGNTYSWSDGPFYCTTEYTKGKIIENIAKYSKYYTSWNWLMPVIEKIEHLGFKTNQIGLLLPYDNNMTVMNTMVINKQNEDSIIYDYVGEWKTSKIEVAYIAVVEFIKWYNKNNN